jgi:hypothetical protein
MEDELLHLLLAYSELNPRSEQAGLRDLLADLRLLARQRGLDFQEALDHSLVNWPPPPVTAFDPRDVISTPDEVRPTARLD